jgi:DNA-binding HxlR family transcriptional regulator
LREGVGEALKLLEGRWKLVILFHLFGIRVLRFSDLERAIPAVSQKMLIQQLRQMEQDGIVHRIVHHQVPPKVEYELAEWGRALYPAARRLTSQYSERSQSYQCFVRFPGVGRCSVRIYNHRTKAVREPPCRLANQRPNSEALRDQSLRDGTPAAAVAPMTRIGAAGSSVFETMNNALDRGWVGIRRPAGRRERRAGLLISARLLLA